MKHGNRIICLLLALTLLLSGCTVQSVTELYRPPKRSDEYNQLQSAMDSAMDGLSFCPPLAGENRQTVQQSDLDGDGEPEYLLYAKGSDEYPLRVLIFDRRDDEGYVLLDTLRLGGASFDQVEYLQMDERPGMELVVGCQVSEQVLRAVSVYTFSGGQLQQLVTSNYTKFFHCDPDGDKLSELLLLCPDSGEGNRGVAVLYGMDKGVMERSQEAPMSCPVENLKRVITGRLHGGGEAVFVGSAVEENAIITDVYAVVDGVFRNITLSADAGMSVQTLRNYYVYADDIDNDGVVELPDLITMPQPEEAVFAQRQDLIRWFALTQEGTPVDKLYTFHDFVGGWYLELGSDWAERVSVAQNGNAFDFYLWNGDEAVKIFTVYAFSGQSRDEQAVSDNRFVLYRGESITYAAYMEVASGALRLSQEDLINSFQLIRQDWKTGET